MMERPREDAHRRFEDMAVTHVLGGLNSNDGRMFRSHLVDCHQCRARVGELRAIAHDLADVERHERRSSERRSVDTKPVEIDVDETDDVDGAPSRRMFLLAIGGLLLLIGLLSWNFVLRSNNSRLAGQTDRLEAAAAGVAFGQEWEVTYPDRGTSARGAVASSENGLSLLLEGAEDTRHRLYFNDAGGQQVGETRVLTPEEGRWLGTISDVPATATRLMITRTNASTQDPAGVVVLDAAAP